MKLHLFARVAAVIAASVFTLAAVPAVALAQEATFPSVNSRHAFTSNGNPLWLFSDSNMSGSVQVGRQNGLLVQLGFCQLPPVFTLCGGTETLNRSIDLIGPTGRVVGHDSHVGESCDYRAHPAFRVTGYGGYDMRVTDTFKVYVNGAIGSGRLRAIAKFHIAAI